MFVLLCDGAPVAQWIEHLSSEQGVVGSSPAGRATVPAYPSGKAGKERDPAGHAILLYES